MGITGKVKAIALATTISLLGLAAAACGGDGGSSSSGAGELVPQRANVVGTIDIEKFLDAIDMDVEQLFELMAAESLGGPEEFGELLDFDPARTGELFSDLSRADIFADASVDGDSDYFGLALRGSFNETALVAEIEAATGSDLAQESYKGVTVYSLADGSDEFTLGLLDSGTFAIGSGGAVKDMIDVINGDADSASGPLIDVFKETSGGFFAFAAQVPQDAFDGDDLGSVPGLGGLPISLDFLSALEMVGMGGDLKGDDLILTVTMDFTDSGAAETLKGFIDGIVTLASGFSSDPRMTELLDGLEVDQDGERLTITVEIPESDLTDIFGDLTTITDTTTSGSFTPGTPEIRMLQIDALGEDVALMPSAIHVPEGQSVQYSTTPPTSGMHWGQWADCGWYPNGLRDETITHNLEHGNIVVSYNLTNPAQVSELRQALEAVPRFETWGVARSYDKIPQGQVAVAAWGRLATFEGISPGAFDLFFEAFAGLLGPERIPC